MLIIGGTGLIGSTLASYSSNKYDLHITANENENKNELNDIPVTHINLLEDRSKIIDLIRKIKPMVTVHAVAFPSVDFCETHPELTNLLHVKVTKDITNICKEIDSKLIFISTDNVFKGNLNRKYNELDKPQPINHYGKTKLQAEKIVSEISSTNVILRTAAIYGWHKRSRFTNWVLSSLMENKVVDPFIDLQNTPTLVDDLVKVILKIIEGNISGLYHATGKTCINRYEFALILAEVFGLNKRLIKPVSSTEKKLEAPRPVSICLDSTKLENLLNYNFKKIKDGITFIHKKSVNSTN